jgi:GNAT superfamily N-acetyltransferase
LKDARHSIRPEVMKIRIATLDDADTLLPFVRAYHEFEGITSTSAERAEAVAPLLPEGTAVGRVWLIETKGEAIGYIALCFGYSIEFGGRDAFVDEFYIAEEARGRGIGSAVLEAVKLEAVNFGVRVLHLEVDRGNHAAKRLYSSAGFASRERFHLMSCRLGGDVDTALPG